MDSPINSLRRRPAAGKIDPASVAFDVDGVIADTMHLFVDIARRYYHIRNIRYDDITCYTLTDCLHHIDAPTIEAIVARIVEGNYALPLEPIAGSVSVLERLCRQVRPVLLVTARPYPGPIADWVQSYLDPDPGAIELVATGAYEAKADVLLDRGIRTFVEDRLETCLGLAAVGIEPVLFKQPWNRMPHPYREVETWQELASLMAL